MTKSDSPGSKPKEVDPARQVGPATAGPAIDGRPLTVVGLGASAGGLAALQAFFDTMPPDTGMAFVVITHMAPDKESLLPEILQRHTAMPVQPVQAFTAVQPNHVYVISPNRRIIMTDTHLDIEEFEEPRGYRAPIDTYFRSQAEAHRDGVAIILSGGGADGSVGVKAIKETGGLLMVQDPEEAEHSSMPRATIATGLADVVLPVRQLATTLVNYYRGGLSAPADPNNLSSPELDSLQQILTQVQTQTGHDFSQYKRSTILRRVQRRMRLQDDSSLADYLAYLRQTPAETRILFNDLLIGVTNFFRDTEAWQVLSARVIPKLFEAKSGGDSLRAWVVGCSTGEEAYSLAILLLEHMAKVKPAPAAQPIKLQIFASDLDEKALAQARQGVYPSAIEADVSSERLERFFTRQGDYYRVRREVRDVVLFSEHNVLRAPPFSRLDFLSCRNLLIYLDRELQESVFDIFYYALKPGGYLFLGSAESAERARDLFSPIDKPHRLYQARPWRSDRPHVPLLPVSMRPREAGRGNEIPARLSTRLSARLPAHLRPLPDSIDPSLALEFQHQRALEMYAPPSILIDDHYQILYVSETAGRYLQQPRGPVTSDLLRLVRLELQADLRVALFQAFRQNKAVVTAPIPVQFNGERHRVTLWVRPGRLEPVQVKPRQAQELAADEVQSQPVEALVLFVEDEIMAVATDEPAGQSAASRFREWGMVEQLETELQRLRDQMQFASEQYELSTEELKAANEELQSINEEYRSTTEELETNKEELQSVNEELQTVNNELKNKLDETARAHSDLENLMQATQIATLFLDRELRIRHYTPEVEELFNIRPSDRGRPIGDLTHQLEYEDLVKESQQVLRSLLPLQREVWTPNSHGRCLLARLRPYRTIEDHIDGLVISFVDVTELKEAEAALRRARDYNENIVNTVREGLLVLRPDLIVEFANESFYHLFAAGEQETVGEHFYRLGHGQWDVADLRIALEEILPLERAFNNFRIEKEFQHIGHRVMLLNGRRLDHTELILLMIEDVTEREKYEQARILNEALEERVRERTRQVEALMAQLTMAEHEERDRIAHILHDELQQQLYSIQVQLLFLRDTIDQEAPLREIEEMETAVKDAINTVRTLSVDLSPPILASEGLTEAIRWLASQMQAQYGLEVRIEAADSFPVQSVDKRVLLFQIVRETLFNVVKHSRVQNVVVALQRQNNLYQIDVIDEGVGFDPPQVLARRSASRALVGQGLLRARERLRFIDGRIELEAAPGAGTRVTIIAPVTAASEPVKEE
jgi:two-component system, chemotaxis family, CheB/CheR fusion protein